MSFLVTARKWRPMVFEDVVGQGHITTTLRNAIASERISHAYIFSGARGCGKTTTARILARAVNCLHPKDQNPDNTCELCLEITENRSVNVFEIDGASNRGVDEIRNLREAVRYGPQKGRFKVYIIDEVHMLTKEAFNALLKTLEEPPRYVIFIFATTEIHKVPPTILSRCQRFDFRRIAVDDIIGRLRLIASAEKISADDDALLLIARRADGSMRDAQSMFDQAVSYCGATVAFRQLAEMWNVIDDEMYFRTTDLVVNNDIKGGILMVQELAAAGVDAREFLNGLIEHFRNLLVTRVTNSTSLVESSEAYRKRYQEQSRMMPERDLLRLIAIASDIAANVRWSQQPRLHLELGIMQMIAMDSSVQISELLSDLQELKKKNPARDGAGSPAAPSPGPVRLQSAPQPSFPAPAAHELRKVISPGAPPPSASGQLLRTPIVLQEAASPSLSLEDVRGKWPSFINEARKQRIDLWSMLSESTLVDVQAERLRVVCPDDFHMDALKRNRKFLTELAERVYGAKVVLDTILEKDAPGKREEESAPAQPQPPPDDGELRRHPVVQSLMKEFGAVIVERNASG